MTAADGMKISAYRTDPVGKPRDGLVVLQEIWGGNDHIRKVADGYAAQGYLVVAPALFDRVERSVMMDHYTPDTMQRGSYDAAAAVLARTRTIKFLQLHVG